MAYDQSTMRAPPTYLCFMCRGWFTGPDLSTRPVCPACRTPVTRYRCIRCDHEWNPAKDVPPKVCPSCKSPYWNRARRTLSALPGPSPSPSPEEGSA